MGATSLTFRKYKHNRTKCIFCDITFYTYVIFLKYKIVWYVPNGFLIFFFIFLIIKKYIFKKF